MGNTLKQIVCHITFALFILSVVQTSFFYRLPKQVLDWSCNFLNTRRVFQLIILRGGKCIASAEYWSHL